MPSIAERIKKVRGDQTRAEFANRIGVHVNTVGRYERGESEPDISVAAKICREFAINPHWLILGKENENETVIASTAPSFYNDEGIGFRYEIKSTDKIHFIELFAKQLAQENEIEMSSKQISAVANLYYEEMEHRLIIIISKIKEIENNKYEL